MESTQPGNTTITGILDTRVSRLLAFGGILLIASGMLLGDIFAIFILHPNNGRIGEAMYGAAMAIPAADTDAIMAQFQAIGGFLENRGTKVDAHSHSISLGYLAVLLAVLQPYVALSNGTKLRLAWAYVLSAALLPFAIFAIHYVGLAYSPLDFIGWASIVADTVALIVAVTVSAQLVGLWRYSRQRQGAGPACLQSITRSGRILLSSGSLLLLAGFVYGGVYAGYIEWLRSPSEVDILKGIITHAAQQQSVEADFAAYGAYQAAQGINVAAHAHVNSMGILLVLLALVQPFVFLSESWKKRWAVIMVVGSAVLPLSILLELRLGLIAGGMADIAGAAVICALVAMLFGLVRQTGATDSA
jgi:hypothetical protein